jgi:L-2,4-diaminobutyric acid acetyltransferase
MSEQDIPESLIIRMPELNDGKSIYSLISECPPLEINSLYSYLLVCMHFDETSAVAEISQDLVGYISTYIHPHKSDTLFIWQIAVKEDMRGKGIAQQMILDILKRKKLQNIKFLETTVTPENLASKSFFRRMAHRMDADFNETLLLTQDDFGELKHPEEFMISIGPLNFHKSNLPVKMGVNALHEN